jgi:hypothetical protein
MERYIYRFIAVRGDGTAGGATAIACAVDKEGTVRLFPAQSAGKVSIDLSNALNIEVCYHIHP